MAKTIFDELYPISAGKAKHTVWILSDLQQGIPENTRRCLESGMADYEELGRPAEMIWYLGDSVEGGDRKRLTEMCSMQEEAFSKLGVPLCYATGNHDYDCCKQEGKPDPWIPFWQMVKDHPGWQTTENCTDFWFRSQVGDWLVYFFTDHIDPLLRWSVTHGRVNEDKSAYPYTQKDADALRERIAAESHPVITAAHYSYPGGNRESGLMGHLMPLPQNLRIHFYGHAHIGDWDWAGKDAYRRICGTDWHDIPQVNVSSFENIRGGACRSVLLHIYEDGGMGIFFRDHDAHSFTEAFFPMPGNAPGKVR